MTALKEIIGSALAEAVLWSLFHHGENYGRAFAREFDVSLDGGQSQLTRLEALGVLVCKRQGRTLVYSWNPKSRLARRLRDLVGVVDEGLPIEEKERIFRQRNRPRSPGKPVL